MNLITDRTKADVLLGNEKGRYGIADLNRVEGAVAELLVLAKPLDINIEQVKTDWNLPGTFSATEWPTVGQMRRYLGNVSRLCRAVEVMANLPASMEDLNWEGANQIERALLAVEARINHIIEVFRYSGEFFAGEENGL